ncbi:hypothetical protein ACTHGU_08310 [Chitinophagaceae bacterium MMS25-I14]
MNETQDLFSGIAEKLTIVAVLVLFLNYFMKELKSVQRLRESDKKDSDKKFEDMFARQFEIEKQNIEAISRQCETNARLTEAIDNLSERIENMRR